MMGHCTTWNDHSPACVRDGSFCSQARGHDGPCTPHGGHRADPVWAEPHGGAIICKTCRKMVVGDGTARDPWRHSGEPREKGVTG
jgi:hypothetical protein